MKMIHIKLCCKKRKFFALPKIIKMRTGKTEDLNEAQKWAEKAIAEMDMEILWICVWGA